MSLGLSIVVPVYNEIHTIDTVLSKVIDALPGVPKEIVLVDDGSKDGTRQWLIDTFGDPTYGPVVSEIGVLSSVLVKTAFSPESLRSRNQS